MSIHRSAAIAGLVLIALAGAGSAHERDPDVTSKAEQRLDKANRDLADRTAKLEARTAEERAKIEADMVKDPRKAADLDKLAADVAKEEQKIGEDAAKAQEDFAEESAKEAADLAERGIDNSGHGSPESLRDLGENEGAEFDRDGFPVRRGEVVGIDLTPAALERAQGKGFTIIARDRLESLGREVIRLAAPRGMDAQTALGELRSIDPAAVLDLVHYYGLNLTAGGKGHAVRGGKMAAAKSSRPVTVGVIDTAIAPHAALRGAQLVPWSAGALPAAPTGHGTAVASLLANEGQAKLYSANIFRGTAERPFTSADVIADALEWMVRSDVQTINMSLAGPRNAILDRLIRDAIAHGRTIVAAAGNGGPAAPPAYPAAVPGVVAVTAVDKDLRIYRYANRGRYITVAAQGVDVLAARAPGGYARYTGTSFAAPHVSAWIARCRAGGGAARSCEAALRKAARDLGAAGRDDIYGAGYLD